MSEPVPRKKPTGGNWTMLLVNAEYTAWQHVSGMCALSSVVFLKDDHLPPHWEWLVSFSMMGRSRLDNNQIEKCIKDFDAEIFEEDNHESGNARKFWLAVDEKYRIPCPCKDEKVISEGDYQYSVKKDGQ